MLYMGQRILVLSLVACSTSPSRFYVSRVVELPKAWECMHHDLPFLLTSSQTQSGLQFVTNTRLILLVDPWDCAIPPYTCPCSHFYISFTIGSWSVAWRARCVPYRLLQEAAILCEKPFKFCDDFSVNATMGHDWRSTI